MLDFLNRNVMHPAHGAAGGEQAPRAPPHPAADAVRPAGGDPRPATRGAAGAAAARLRHGAVLPRRVGPGRRPPRRRESLADLEAFPILTKADIRRHERALVSSAFDIAKLRVKTTSGSTGVPLTIYIDEAGRAVEDGLHAPLGRVERLAARRSASPRCGATPSTGTSASKGRLRNAFFDRAVYLDTLNLNDDRIAEFAARIRRHRPGLIFGHAHSLYLLAVLARRSRGVTDIRPNGIISTAMVLHDWQRRRDRGGVRLPGDEPLRLRGSEPDRLRMRGASRAARQRGQRATRESRRHPAPPGKPGSLVVTDLPTRHAADPLPDRRRGRAVGAGCARAAAGCR